MTEFLNINELRVKIGRNLSAIRHLRGEKQEIPAEAINVKASVISRIETGSYDSFTLDQLAGLCNHYQITLQQILELEITQIFNYSQNNHSGSHSLTNQLGDGFQLAQDTNREQIEYLRSQNEKLIAALSELSKK